MNADSVIKLIILNIIHWQLLLKINAQNISANMNYRTINHNYYNTNTHTKVSRNEGRLVLYY